MKKIATIFSTIIFFCMVLIIQCSFQGNAIEKVQSDKNWTFKITNSKIQSIKVLDNKNRKVIEAPIKVSSNTAYITAPKGGWRTDIIYKVYLDTKDLKSNKINSNLLKTFMIVGKNSSKTVSAIKVNNNVQATGNEINIKYPPNNLIGAKGDGITDDTTAIQNIINSCSWGDTLYFPKGTYKVSGLTIPIAINIIGYSKLSTIIKNTSVTNPCIKIKNTLEMMRIQNIGIWGNGTTIYGTNATSSYGIMLDGCVLINIDNIWMRGHGNHSIYATSTHVNNINISNSEIEWGKKDGINIITHSSSGQKNAIYINNCNIAGNGRNGISIWGNSISISHNTIQGNKGTGVSVDSDLVNGQYTASGISITENYFELCSKGFIRIKANIDKGLVKCIVGLRLIGNYGGLYSSQVDPGITSVVWVEDPTHYPTFSLVRDFEFDNSFTSDKLNVLNANDCLTSESIINIPYQSLSFFTKLGAAKVEYLKSKVINGYFYAKGVSYDLITGKSHNITTDSVIYFPFDIGSFNNLRAISVYCNTNSSNYTVKFDLMNRAKNTIDTYTSKTIGQVTSHGNQIISIGGTSINTDNVNIDMYLRITISFKSAGTYFYLGNPVITTTQ